MQGHDTEDDDGASMLSPPDVRQPYTPPPQYLDDNEVVDSAKSIGEKHLLHTQQLQHSSQGIESVAFCAFPANDYTSPPPQSQRRKISPSPTRSETSLSIGAVLCKAIVDHQLGLSINVFLFAGLSWLLFPSLRPGLESFATLCYRSVISDGEKETALYGQGPRDLCIVLTLMVLFTGVRAAVLDYVLTPLAVACGIKKKKLRTRFAEQTYLIVYYGLYWGWGVYLLYTNTAPSMPTLPDGQPKPLNVNNFLISLWTHYPRLLLDAPMKLYYLSQLAFWTQQIAVVHLEERRKDHYNMLAHHLITVALLITSYGYRQMRVGNAVLVCMDIIDLIFPTAKVFKYLGWQTACDFMFALFVVTWLACRHVGYLSICWSIYAHVDHEVMPFGVYSVTPSDSLTSSNNGIVSGFRISDDGGNDIWSNLFQPLLNPGAKTVSFNRNVKWTFLGMLLGLQCITILWFVMICRVVARVLRGEGADDSRSDDEEEGEVDEDEDSEETKTVISKDSVAITPAPAPEPRYIEVEASSADFTATNFKRTSSSSSKRRSKGLSTGLNLGDHKEILNRIGCLSEEQLAREREKRSPGPSKPASPRR